MAVDEAALLQVHDVGQVVAASILNFFAEPHNRDVIAQLAAAGVHASAPEQASGSDLRLADKTLVLSGSMPNWTRDEAPPSSLAAAGNVSGSVSNKTAHVVAGAEEEKKK